jgi:hypothetical protein
MEGDLRDDQWEVIAPLLPLPKKRGRPRTDDRKTINGILWMLCSGARWRDLKDGLSSVLLPWVLTRAMTALTLDTNRADDIFSLPYPVENGLSAVADQVALLKRIGPASFAGRWSAAMVGWTTGGGWWCATTGTLIPTLPF